MKKLEYTHYAKFQGIPCFFNVETDALTGRNWFYSLLLDAAIFIERHFPSNDRGFEIAIGEELEEGNLVH